MIIDAHAHVFPHFQSAAAYKSVQTLHRMTQQRQSEIEKFWGKMRTSTLDRKFIPRPGEDVSFVTGKFGRYYWIKHGEKCWLQRFPTLMVEMEWPPEYMIAFMDAIGVDKAVLQAEYMEMNYCLEYFSDTVKRWPDRFIGTVAIDYDIDKSEQYRQGELEKLRKAVRDADMRGVYQGYSKEQKIDDRRFRPYWTEISNLKIPHFFLTGFQPKQRHLESLDRIERVLKEFPDVVGIIGHLGGNIRSPVDPDWSDSPTELFNILNLPNVYFEVGYVLAYENWDVWKEDYEYPYSLHTKLVNRVYDRIGAERLLWSSDMPNTYRTCTYLQCLDLVRIHFDFMNQKEKNLVLGGNAAKLFRVNDSSAENAS